jgi:hypothetical protein
MPKNSNYISTNRSMHYLKCHLIFVCKYRKELLTEPLKQDMKEILLAIAGLSDFENELFESDGQSENMDFNRVVFPPWRGPVIVNTGYFPKSPVMAEAISLFIIRK